MTKTRINRRLSRRHFLRLGGGALAAAGVNLWSSKANQFKVVQAAATSAIPAPALTDISLAATDGWVSLPTSSGQAVPGFPDPLAPGGKTTYVFGFRNVTGLSDQDVFSLKGKAQISAPILYVDEEADVRITLTNLGLVQRPDLVDSHTIHWHGFRDAIPLFDGVPEMSVAVPISRKFTYYYKPHAAGTYMYHCHFEDVEHVQMGMTGAIFVRPKLNKTAGGKFAYNDTSTAYDREFVIFLSELWAQAHYNDAHIQQPLWSDYDADFWLMNGRSYPDTLKPTTNPLNSPTDALQYQPISSLVTANAGEKVLLRFVNLGYQQHSMVLEGIPLRIVGKDATLLKTATANTSYTASTIYIGPGESYDAIFTAPSVSNQTNYLLYNRKFASLNNGGVAGKGGQMTEVRISPAGTLPAQTEPNT